MIGDDDILEVVDERVKTPDARKARTRTRIESALQDHSEPIGEAGVSGGVGKSRRNC